MIYFHQIQNLTLCQIEHCSSCASIYSLATQIIYGKYLFQAPLNNVTYSCSLVSSFIECVQNIFRVNLSFNAIILLNVSGFKNYVSIEGVTGTFSGMLLLFQKASHCKDKIINLSVGKECAI